MIVGKLQRNTRTLNFENILSCFTLFSSSFINHVLICYNKLRVSYSFIQYIHSSHLTPLINCDIIVEFNMCYFLQYLQSKEQPL